jgi:hypothetical protein
VHVKGALAYGQSLEKKYGRLSCWNGDPARCYVRKPSFHFGWDWGPKSLSVGFGPVRLVSDQRSRIISL